MAETQNDPLLPGYSFNAHLVAGLTPIEANGYLDFFIDRPLGMKGYILNLTIRGEGVINNNGEQFVCRPGDMLLFPPGEIHHYGRHPDASEWYHQWVLLSTSRLLAGVAGLADNLCPDGIFPPGRGAATPF
ncbi:arabinose operon regulatory protein [Salmonella bongori]|nr:arabinose operon regulatory protein [Salmonella bongori]